MPKASSRFRGAISAIPLLIAAAVIAPPALAQTATTVELVPGSEVTSLPGVAFDQGLADKLPAAIRSTGALKIVTTAYTPPIAYFGPDNKEIIGVDADIAKALGVLFGLKIEMTDIAAFPALIPALKAKRFDLAISGANDTPALEKQVDVVDYMYDGKTIMVQRGNPQHITAMADLCGKKVAVSVGSLQEQMVQAQSAKCATPIDIVSIPKQPDVLVAVRTGRVDATVNGYATSIYTTKHQLQNGVGLDALPDVRLAVGYLGMLTNKDDSQLRDAVAAGLQTLVTSGAYAQIMQKWGLDPLAIKDVKINDGINIPINF